MFACTPHEQSEQSKDTKDGSMYQMVKAKEETPEVSVIIPTLNSVMLTGEAVESVLAQTFKNFEILVIDDGSAVEAQQELKELLTRLHSCGTIKYFAFDKNRGVSAARNFGLTQARGRFIAFLDADDLWRPEKLQKQLKYMRKHDADFSFTTYLNVDQISGRHVKREPPKIVGFDTLLGGNVIGTSTVIIDRRNARMPEFAPLKMRQDYAFWLSLLSSGHRAYGLQEDLTIRRQFRGSLSSKKSAAIIATWRMFRFLPDSTLFNSTIRFFRYLIFSAGNEARRLLK